MMSISASHHNWGTKIRLSSVPLLGPPLFRPKEMIRTRLSSFLHSSVLSALRRKWRGRGNSGKKVVAGKVQLSPCANGIRVLPCIPQSHFRKRSCNNTIQHNTQYWHPNHVLAPRSRMHNRRRGGLKPSTASPHHRSLRGVGPSESLNLFLVVSRDSFFALRIGISFGLFPAAALSLSSFFSVF